MIVLRDFSIKEDREGTLNNYMKRVIIIILRAFIVVALLVSFNVALITSIKHFSQVTSLKYWFTLWYLL